jgi:cell division protein ZapE
MDSLSDHYQQAIRDGLLQPDAAQELAVVEFENLVTRVTAPTKKSLFTRKADPIKGLYVYGPVGRGKTMMMDWCRARLIAENKRVERWHFHAFMLKLHERLRDLTAHSPDLEDRLKQLADYWVERLDVLCFDEFHVTDVADAMIMMPLFTQFFDRGLVVIATSNWEPTDLYSGGLQRQRFLPFIDRLKESMVVVNVSGDRDYRELKAATATGWLYPLNEDTYDELQTRFRDHVGYDSVETHEIHVGKRTWTLPRASKKCAWVDMASLLDQPLGAADFIALATRYRFLFLDNLDIFRDDQNERAKRFMTLIDALYEHKVFVVVRCASALEDVYSKTGKLAFEFARTQSRLKEMTVE